MAVTTPPAARPSPTRSPKADERVPRPVHLVFGMMETKDAHAFIAPFKGLVERVYTVPILEEANAFSAEALAEIAASEGFDVTPASGVAHALYNPRRPSAAPGAC